MRKWIAAALLALVGAGLWGCRQAEKAAPPPGDGGVAAEPGAGVAAGTEGAGSAGVAAGTEGAGSAGVAAGTEGEGSAGVGAVAEGEGSAGVGAVAGTCEPLDAARVSAFVRLSLDCVDREYPNKPSNIVDGDETVLPPRELTPAFFGCFDWHSAVHGHWAMVRALKAYPELAEADAIRRVLADHLTRERLAAELGHFAKNRNKLFERPYGWAWFLRLAAELRGWDSPEAAGYLANMQGLVALLSRRTEEYVRALSVPVRVGTHNNTAFALAHILDYARGAGDTRLETTLVEAALRFYGEDRGCPVGYEPSGEDFVSPCLAEADLMRRVLAPEAYVGWLEGFLPPPDSPSFAAIAEPPEIRDRHDPRIGHLIGLDFHRAWCFEGIAGALPADHAWRPALFRAAALHCTEGVGQMFDSGYGGAHWLASFALFHLSGANGAAAPAQ
jgi:hypothetical protein